MKICIICEGSYPYVTGGVSSWINMLIRNMPEHEFIIYAIGAKEESRGQYKYELPENVIEVKEVFLDEIYKLETKGRIRNLKIEEKYIKAFRDLMSDESVNWPLLIEFMRGVKVKSVMDIFMSKQFFDLLSEICVSHFKDMPFNDFFWTMRSMLLPMLYLIRQEIPEADVYHSVSAGYGGLIGAIGKQVYKKPYILTEHGIYAREREEEIIKAEWVKGHFKDEWIHFFYNLSRLSYYYADEVITLFNLNRKIEIELGCAPEKISIIPNGVEISRFENVKRTWEDDGSYNIGAVVRIVPIKDIKTMISAFGLVKEEIPHAKLYIMGPMDEEPKYYEECQMLIEEFGISDVIFTGSVNVAEYLGNMDVNLLTSISEGQPLAVLEAMAAKKPCITTQVGSCSELLYGAEGDDLGDAGVVVPIMDEAKLAQALVKLGHNKQLREEMGQIAFERVRQYYTKEAFIESYKDIYKRLHRSKA
nr:GT4 family glycosyltransferase PelF [uncultured Cellulosilyticum sp.]